MSATARKISEADIANVAEIAAKEMFRKLGTSRDYTYGDLFDARMCIEDAIRSAFRIEDGLQSFAGSIAKTIHKV